MFRTKKDIRRPMRLATKTTAPLWRLGQYNPLRVFHRGRN
nr:MAG TPA: hypothetical protein [Caudoviricetes sp.]